MVTLTKTPAVCWDTAGIDLTHAEYAAYMGGPFAGRRTTYVEADRAAELRDQWETRLRIARAAGDWRTAAAYGEVLREFGELLGGGSG